MSDDVRRFLMWPERMEPDGWPVLYVDFEDYDRLAVELERARAAARTFHETLARIAGAESGIWGVWAHEALRAHPDFSPEA